MNAATLFVWFQNTVAPWLVDRASRIRIKDCLWYSEIAGVVVKIKAEHLLIDTHTHSPNTHSELHTTTTTRLRAASSNANVCVVDIVQQKRTDLNNNSKIITVSWYNVVCPLQYPPPQIMLLTLTAVNGSALCFWSDVFVLNVNEHTTKNRQQNHWFLIEVTATTTQQQQKQ